MKAILLGWALLVAGTVSGGDVPAATREKVRAALQKKWDAESRAQSTEMAQKRFDEAIKKFSAESAEKVVLEALDRSLEAGQKKLADDNSKLAASLRAKMEADELAWKEQNAKIAKLNQAHWDQMAQSKADQDRLMAKLKAKDARARLEVEPAPIVTAPPAKPAPRLYPWRAEKEETTVIRSAGPPPTSGTVYGADGEIRRYWTTGTGTATIYGPEGFTKIYPK
jgi:hypothetical protein